MQHKKYEIYTAIEEYINDFVDSEGVPPPLSKIADSLGLNKSTVCRYLAAMEENGLIVFDEFRKPHTMQMMNDLRNTNRTSVRGTRAVSVVGSIACGGPQDSEEYIEETVKLPSSIFGNDKLFILHASGESMIDLGIEDGDLVVVRVQNHASKGDVVVALTPDGTTLKGFYPEPEKQRIRLQPANRDMKPMYYHDVIIQGVAVNVIKKVGKMIDIYTMGR